MRRRALDAASPSDSASDPPEDTQPPPALPPMATPAPNQEVPQEPGPFPERCLQVPLVSWSQQIHATEVHEALGCHARGRRHQKTHVQLSPRNRPGSVHGAGMRQLTLGRHKAMQTLWAESGSLSAPGRRCHFRKQRGPTENAVQPLRTRQHWMPGNQF